MAEAAHAAHPLSRQFAREYRAKPVPPEPYDLLAHVGSALK